MTKWFWNTKCELCGYYSPFYQRQWIAKALAFWHSVTQHPFGHCTIAAIDETKRVK
jgi:hypothetical protein